MSDYRPKPAKLVDIGAIVQEAKKYEAERDRMEKCGISTTQAVNCIVLNGILHAGVVSHICRKPAGHDGNCRCCGYEWRGK